MESEPCISFKRYRRRNNLAVTSSHDLYECHFIVVKFGKKIQHRHGQTENYSVSFDAGSLTVEAFRGLGYLRPRLA